MPGDLTDLLKKTVRNIREDLESAVPPKPQLREGRVNLQNVAKGITSAVKDVAQQKVNDLRDMGQALSYQMIPIKNELDRRLPPPPIISSPTEDLPKKDVKDILTELFVTADLPNIMQEQYAKQQVYQTILAAAAIANFLRQAAVGNRRVD